MSTSRTVLILTATVTPNTLVNVANVDPRERLLEYQRSIRYWAIECEKIGAQLFIVETSSASEEQLFADVPAGVRSRIHLINYSPSSSDADRGKGYLEWSAIATVFQSGLVEANDSVYKVTGRLRVKNFSRVFMPVPDATAVARMKIDGSLADTRVLGASGNVWTTWLLPAADLVRLGHGVDIEQAVGATLKYASVIKQVEIQQFRYRPLFEGSSGYTGKPYVPWRTAVRSFLLRPLELLVGSAARRLAR